MFTKTSIQSAVRAVLVASAFAVLQPVSGAKWGADYFPNVPLITQDGKTVHFYDDLLKGKKVIINFIYTTCGDSCPLETARLGQVRRILGDHMGRDIFFYSISVDPARDTAAELKSYADKYHAGPGWLFLTGQKEDIELIRRKLGLGTRNGENEITDHSTSLMIGDEASGQWIKDGSMDNPQYIAAIVRDWLSPGKDRIAGNSYTDAPSISPSVSDKGAYLFQGRCAACHTIGKGDSLGPDLRGVTRIRNRDWLAHIIAAPNELLAQKDPIATALFAKYKQVRMPNLRLGDKDVKALLAYLESQDSAGK